VGESEEEEVLEGEKERRKKTNGERTVRNDDHDEGESQYKLSKAERKGYYSHWTLARTVGDAVEVNTERHHCDACCRAFRGVEGEAGHEEEDGHEREGDEEEGAAAVAGKGEKSQYGRRRRRRVR
jgi:hypothetical protein